MSRDDERDLIFTLTLFTALLIMAVLAWVSG